MAVLSYGNRHSRKLCPAIRLGAWDPGSAPPVPTAQQRYPKRSQLASRKAAGDDRILLHETPRRVFVGCLENGDAGVPGAECWADEDQQACRERALERLEMDRPNRTLVVGHRRREVV